MSFDWIEYLTLAFDLIDQVEVELMRSRVLTPSHESKLRTGISRASYAAFRQAYLFLVSENPNVDIPKSAAHSAVYRKFREGRSQNHHKIAERLRDLRNYREWADYDPVAKPNLIIIARANASNAREVFTLLDNLNVNPPRN